MQRAAGAELEGGEALAQGAEEGIATERAEFNRAECWRALRARARPLGPRRHGLPRGCGPAEISTLSGRAMRRAWSTHSGPNGDLLLGGPISSSQWRGTLPLDQAS